MDTSCGSQEALAATNSPVSPRPQTTVIQCEPHVVQDIANIIATTHNWRIGNFVENETLKNEVCRYRQIVALLIDLCVLHTISDKRFPCVCVTYTNGSLQQAPTRERLVLCADAEYPTTAVLTSSATSRAVRVVRANAVWFGDETSVVGDNHISLSPFISDVIRVPNARRLSVSVPHSFMWGVFPRSSRTKRNLLNHHEAEVLSLLNGGVCCIDIQPSRRNRPIFTESDLLHLRQYGRPCKNT